MKKKLFVLLVSIAMVVTMMPMSVFATAEGNAKETQEVANTE